jgi:hypothetical protein
MLDAALGGAGDDETVGDIMVRAIVAYPDETLRAVANRMADLHVSRLPVVDREDSSRIRGLVTLVDLLAGRRKDVHEERHSERILRLRVRSGRPAHDAAADVGPADDAAADVEPADAEVEPADPDAVGAPDAGRTASLAAG